MIILYVMALFGFLFYSYALVDPNLTFINHPVWNQFRNIVLPLGYFQREQSWYVYLALILLFFLFNLFFIKKYKEMDVLKIAFIIGGILLFAYPFLSHDLFNYLFDAKIVTFYHQNPYFLKPLDFPNDQWLRFMHWTHRTYPYGPVFLGLSLIPSFLSLGKFILSFLFFKTTIVVFYLLTVFCLQKMNKKWAIIFATHPLILFEGLVNGHNDMFALFLGIIGIYYLNKNKNLWAKILFLLSFGIKYITAPVIVLVKKHTLRNHLILIVQLGIILYLSFTTEIQPWYFLALFIFLPYYEVLLSRFNLFFAGLLLSYYPYIRLGGWDSTDKINLKHQIIVTFLGINIFYISLIYFKRLSKKFFAR